MQISSITERSPAHEMGSKHRYLHVLTPASIFLPKTEPLHGKHSAALGFSVTLFPITPFSFKFPPNTSYMGPTCLRKSPARRGKTQSFTACSSRMIAACQESFSARAAGLAAEPALPGAAGSLPWSHPLMYHSGSKHLQQQPLPHEQPGPVPSHPQFSTHRKASPSQMPRASPELPFFPPDVE